jgi:hypothetical protein
MECLVEKRDICDFMDIDFGVNCKRSLAYFLASQMCIDSSDQGYFAVLPNELLRIIMTFVQEDITFTRICQVNHKFYEMAQPVWREFCKQRGLLQDEQFWNQRGKTWKWILQAKTRVFKGDTRNGVGCYEEPEKSRYEGDWLNNVPSGWGIETIAAPPASPPTGQIVAPVAIYKGQFVAGQREGEGIFMTSNGASYTGQWRHGKKNGLGNYIFPTGDQYFGNWKDDMKHGHGVYEFGKGNWEGDKYEGEWKDNKKWGHGVYIWKDGDKYVGEFEDDNFNGTGTYFFSCGDRYVGQWKSDKRSGFGQYIYNHGGSYEGYFKDGKRNGSGVFVWKDGDSFTGEWRQGSRKGRGVFTRADGVQFEQVWDEAADANYSLNPPPKYPQ